MQWNNTYYLNYIDILSRRLIFGNKHSFKYLIFRFIYKLLFKNTSNQKTFIGVKLAVKNVKKNDMETWHDILSADVNVF